VSNRKLDRCDRCDRAFATGDTVAITDLARVEALAQGDYATEFAHSERENYMAVYCPECYETNCGLLNEINRAMVNEDLTPFNEQDIYSAEYMKKMALLMTGRINADRRRRTLPESDTHTYYPTSDLDILGYNGTGSLREEAEWELRRGEVIEIASVEADGMAERGKALYIPRVGRIGITWGADPTWADADSLEEGIRMYVEDGDEYERLN
jgi:hypothetical protein